MKSITIVSSSEKRREGAGRRRGTEFRVAGAAATRQPAAWQLGFVRASFSRGYFSRSGFEAIENKNAVFIELAQMFE